MPLSTIGSAAALVAKASVVTALAPNTPILPRLNVTA